MGFWIFMLIMDLLTPALMIVFGWVFLKRPPKDINGFYGYRTARSMKNKDTWAFAHKVCGKLWLRVGVVMAVLSVLAAAFFFRKDTETVGTTGGVLCLVQCGVLLLTIIPVEKTIKENFKPVPGQGKPRENDHKPEV